MRGRLFLTGRLSISLGIESDAVFRVFRRADAGFGTSKMGSTVGSGDMGGLRQGSPLRGDPALASDLASGGIRAVSLANNHTGNYGREVLLQTIATLDKENIAHAGAGGKIDQAFSPAVVKAGHLTIAFFSMYGLY